METLILDHKAIALKLDRIAWQILETNHNEKSIVLVGLVDRGTEVAAKLYERLTKISSSEISLTSIQLDKKDPLNSEITLDQPELIHGNCIILVDDVLNSGLTLSAAFKEVLAHSPKSVHTAVLANRDHHKFPIQANFVGISLATTLQEHITYSETDGQMKVVLS